MPAGPTQRQIARFAGQHLIHKAVMRKVLGMVAGVRSYEPTIPVDARLLESSKTAKGAHGSIQSYDGQVIVATSTSFLDVSATWEMKLVEFMAPREEETAGGDPEVKRTRYFRVNGGEQLQGADGGDFLELLNVENDGTKPAW